MVSNGDKRSQVYSMLSRAFIISIIAVALVISAVSIYSIVFRKAPSDGRRISQQAQTVNAENDQIFTGIGQMRISTSDPQPAVVILFVSFIYDPANRAFTEELVLRIGEFRDIISAYLGSFTAEDLRNMNEESIKRELLSRFNALLRLGQIQIMFFSDFIVIG